MTQQEVITCLLQRLERLGVREVCVAAGARNAPLVAALTDSTGIRLWHFFEERCAGFFALGRTMVDQRPVAVFRRHPGPPQRDEAQPVDRNGGQHHQHEPAQADRIGGAGGQGRGGRSRHKHRSLK